MKTLLKILSWTISILFHPLIFATIGSVLLFLVLPQYKFFEITYSIRFLLFIFVLTYILPLFAVPLYFLILKLTKSEVSEHHQRIFLLLSTAIFYIFTYKITLDFPAFKYISLYMLLCCIHMIYSLLITYYWKISLHMIGIGGFLGLVLFLSLIHVPLAIQILPFTILLAGFIATSRLYLEAHTSAQIYTGLSLGVTTSVIFSYIFFI